MKAPKARHFSGLSYDARVALAVLHKAHGRSGVGQVLELLGMSLSEQELNKHQQWTAEEAGNRAKRSSVAYKRKRSRLKLARKQLGKKHDESDEANGIAYGPDIASTHKPKPARKPKKRKVQSDLDSDAKDAAPKPPAPQQEMWECVCKRVFAKGNVRAINGHKKVCSGQAIEMETGDNEAEAGMD